MLEAGLVVADRYLLEAELGRGGMGAVWRARHLTLDTPCAVKFIISEAGAEADLYARFEREARAAAKLRSPNVVQVLDHGTWRGVPYIVMELLDGEDLAARLARVGHLTVTETMAIARDVARALTRAHAAGIVHRDLKPENIYLTGDGDREIAKVLDFGIAKVSALDAGVATKTKTGSLIGTPHYMSPEQAEGLRAVDHRSDLWAFAVILIECLSGRKPFDSDALGDLLMCIIHKPVPTAEALGLSLGSAFEAWWRRASERSPDARFSSARELVEGLEAAFPDEAELGPSSLGNRPRRIVITPVESGATLSSGEGPASARSANPSSPNAGFANAHDATLLGAAAPATLAGQTTPIPKKGRPLALIWSLAGIGVLALGAVAILGPLSGKVPSGPSNAASEARSDSAPAAVTSGVAKEPTVQAAPPDAPTAPAAPSSVASPSASAVAVSPVVAPPAAGVPRPAKSTKPPPTSPLPTTGQRDFGF